MAGLSRRTFLTRSSLALAVGSVTAVPGLSAIVETAQEQAPEVEGAASESEAAAADLTGPLVAHVSDLRSGEISFYEGERQGRLQGRRPRRPALPRVALSRITQEKGLMMSSHKRSA